MFLNNKGGLALVPLSPLLEATAYIADWQYTLGVEGLGGYINTIV